jgi:hypothetical protein
MHDRSFRTTLQAATFAPTPIYIPPNANAILTVPHPGNTTPSTNSPVSAAKGPVGSESVFIVSRNFIDSLLPAKSQKTTDFKSPLAATGTSHSLACKSMCRD